MTIFTGHTMDFTAQVEWAQRDDGQWFSRTQGRDARFGYRWSAWRKSGAPSDSARATTRTARLPVDGVAPRARPVAWLVECVGPTGDVEYSRRTSGEKAAHERVAREMASEARQAGLPRTWRARAA